MQILKSIIERLRNKGTILAIVGGLVTIAIQLGVKVDSQQVMTVVETICAILIALGVMNNPVGNTKAYIPGISDSLAEKQPKADEIKAEAKKELENVVNQVEEVKTETSSIVNEGK